jgi:branched-chain amino acid transport system permease protein
MLDFLLDGVIAERIVRIINNPMGLYAQLMLGVSQGAFYAILSLGLAVIFGMLNVINFTHGAQYMLGAFFTWALLEYLGIGYWWAVVLVPIIVGLSGAAIELTLLRRLYKLDHLYGLLLTFGLALVMQGLVRNFFGTSGLPYPRALELSTPINLGFMFFPGTRAWTIVGSVVICIVTWLVIEKTKIGAYLRAGTENPILVQAMGINVPLMLTVTYAFGVGLAGYAGVLAAQVQSINPQMGADLIIVVFAVVVIGGMGSILGSILTGFGLGMLEGLTKVIYPEASATVIFVIMVIVLLTKPAGLFGRNA